SNQLGHIICQQLREQPLVVLPGFGGFVKDAFGAKLDELRNRIHPPKNSVIFNSKLAHNDGLLLAAIASELEMTYSDADKWLTDAISEIRFSLNNGEMVSLDGLGQLKKSIEGSIEFTALELPLIQDEFFGLKPVSLVRVEKDNVDKVRELVAADGPVATKVRTLPIKRIASYAAAAIAVGFLMWMPIQNGALNNGKMLVHQLNPFAVTTESAYQSRQFDEAWLSKGFEKEDVLADKFNHEYLKLYLAKNTGNAIVVKTDAVPSEEVKLEVEAPTAEIVNEAASSFKVIAATFVSKSDAADYVAKMIKRGFSAEYAGQDSQGHMVAYGTYNSLEDAKKMLASVSLSNKEARIVSGN
ncbi:MAG: SPOR domain-containing protein, partial [Flavobacteriales bacterium]|nr:SPOR domain-containing protein [Flavobacteriales bacterium]